jgi:hypothetical protein
VGQVKLDSFFDSFTELVQAPGLGVTSGKLRDVGDKIPIFVLFNDDAERFFHFFPRRHFSLADSILKEKMLFINGLSQAGVCVCLLMASPRNTGTWQIVSSNAILLAFGRAAE